MGNEDWPSLAALAGDIGIGLTTIHRYARELGFNLHRGAAKVSPKQQQRLRERAIQEGGRVRHKIVSSEPLTREEMAQRQAERIMAPLMTFWSMCTCCALKFDYQAEAETTRLTCDRCSEHYAFPGETDARMNARNQDHATRLLPELRDAVARADEAKDETRHAYRSRHKFKVALVEVILAHVRKEDGTCVCGADAYPCFTVRKFEQVNPGLARYVIEKLGSMSDDALRRELYPEEFPVVFEDDNWILLGPPPDEAAA